MWMIHGRADQKSSKRGGSPYEVGKEGDIHPTDAAAVISAKAGNLYASDMKWGFVSSGGGF